MKSNLYIPAAAVVCLSLAAPASAVVSSYWPDMDEAEAAYTTVSKDGLSRSYVSSGFSVPFIGSRPKECSYTGKPGAGAYCIKLAGGSALGDFSAVKFYWRPANQGHDTKWEACSEGSGCRVFSFQILPDGRTVATFMIYHVSTGVERDIRMDLTFKSVPVLPPAKEDAGAKVYRRWDEKHNSTGKRN